jgi:uncharacterized protein YraI
MQNGITATSAPLLITATLPTTSTPLPSEIPSALPQPTVAPLEGVTSTQLNVRVRPSTASEVIGIIAANSMVHITGRDVGENWWQIIYDAGEGGKGWVTAQYVETGDSSKVPVIGGNVSNPQSGNTAVVIQQLNIRSGPGTSFNSLGILNEDDVVNLTGKNNNGTWFRFDFPAGPDGMGWVNSGFVKTDDSTSLPIVSDTGEVIGTGTPVNTPLPPTPTLVPAPLDFDSADAPIKTVILEDAGTHTVLYNGDVSAPAGDREDWFQITSSDSLILLEITCKGSNPTINLIQSGQVLNSNTNPYCATQKIVAVAPGIPVQVHVSALIEDSQNYSSYTIKVSIIP